jgi:di/tricarboxylate transporter
MGLSRDLNVSPSKLLMPLSFGALFGGVCTLIGTSTNILVSAMAVKYGAPAFGMFEFTKFGVIILVAGILYMALIGVRLIPERGFEKGMALEDVRRDYLVEVMVGSDAEFIGETISHTPLAKLDVEVQEIVRSGQKVRLPAREVALQPGDVLRVRCDVDQVRKLKELDGYTLRSEATWHDTLEKEGTLLVEAVIGPNSRLEGQTLKNARFRTLVGGTVHGIRHRGRLMRTHLEDIVLYPGDVLLIEVPNQFVELLHGYQAFVIISEVNTPDFRRQKIPVALTIIVAVVASAALGIVPILVSAIAGSVLMVLTGCLTLEEAYGAIQWKIVFLLGGVLALGLAMEKTGTALFLANQLVATVGTWGPMALMSAFYLMTSVTTGVMSNNATAALLIPIAIATAEAMGVDSRPFLMAVTYAASASFMTPVGYQSNTLIYGPGRYKFADFLKVGTPLNLIFWLLATFMIPIFWPFNP